MLNENTVRLFMVKLRQTIDYLLHQDASELIFSRSKTLRKNVTDAEKLLWHRLRNRKVEGCKFRRQHPIGKYIADFYCHEKRLVVEIDGSVHHKSEILENDLNRTAVFNQYGIDVIRFTNEEVLNYVDNVLRVIAMKLAERTT